MRRSFRPLVLWLAVSIGASLPVLTQASDLMREGQRQLDAGKLDQAMLTFQRLVEEEPGSSLGHTRLGGVRLLRQEYRASVASFQRAIALDPRNADAFVGMALAYLHLGEYGLARESLNQAQLLDPSKRDEIERVMTWIDRRSMASSH
jgi:tetratricopeptide (TPR) repeat protein